MNWPTFELNEEHLTFHLQCKHSGTFANRKYEELSYPKKSENFRPILVTLLKMQPQYSQSSRENATPSSGISSSAFYKEVHSRGPRLDWQFQWLFSNTHLTTCLFSNTHLASDVGVIFLPPVVRKEIRLPLKRLLGRLQYTLPAL